MRREIIKSEWQTTKYLDLHQHFASHTFVEINWFNKKSISGNMNPTLLLMPVILQYYRNIVLILGVPRALLAYR